MTISLKASPFYVLGVSLRDDRAKIAEAVERALEDGDSDEQAIIRAQQILMAPKSRLAAELASLPGIAPARARQLVEAPSIDAKVLSELPPLAGANVAADRCSSDHEPHLRRAILDFHAGRSDAETAELLNVERAIIGFPPVAPDLLTYAMPQLRRRLSPWASGCGTCTGAPASTAAAVVL